MLASCDAQKATIANNSFTQSATHSGVSRMLGVGYSNNGTCTSRVTFKNNGWYAPGGSPRWYYSATALTSLAGWQGVAPGGDTNATAADPVFVTPIGGGINCGSTSGPQPCPAGYAIQTSSTYKDAGLDLVAASLVPSGIVPLRDYYGKTLPTGSGTGYPIGASTGH